MCVPQVAAMATVGRLLNIATADRLPSAMNSPTEDTSASTCSATTLLLAAKPARAGGRPLKSSVPDAIGAQCTLRRSLLCSALTGLHRTLLIATAGLGPNMFEQH